MLTGQEQYYWERAGYFIRREMLNTDGVRAWQRFVADIHEKGDGRIEEPQAVGDIRELVQEVLGPQWLTSNRRRDPIAQAWSRGIVRGNQLPVNSTPGELARTHKCVTVCVACDADESLLVVPGSHAEALDREQLTALEENPLVVISGQVSVRLTAGDALLFCPSLLRRLKTRLSASSSLVFLDFYI